MNRKRRIAASILAIMVGYGLYIWVNGEEKPEPDMNDRIIAATAKCAEASMMPVIEQATSFWGVNDPFIIVCKPAQFSLLEKLTFQIELENKAKDEAKKRPTMKPANPDSFETKSKVTQ